jgi:hypothetical protein
MAEFFHQFNITEKIVSNKIVWTKNKNGKPKTCRKMLIRLVETRGVEPLTSAMPLQRSAKLSYVPVFSMILPFDSKSRIENITICF